MAKRKTKWLKLADNNYWDEHVVCHKGLLQVAAKCGWFDEANKAERIQVHWEDSKVGECEISNGLGGINVLGFDNEGWPLTWELAAALVGIAFADSLTAKPHRGHIWVEMEWHE